MLSTWIETVWEYKVRPALGGEMPLQPGKMRVRWTCVCKRRYYDDFIEILPGAVERAQASLNEIYEGDVEASLDDIYGRDIEASPNEINERDLQAIPAQSTLIWLSLGIAFMLGFLKSIMDDCEKVRTYSYKLTEGNSKESKLLYESDNFTAKGFSVLYTRVYNPFVGGLQLRTRGEIDIPLLSGEQLDTNPPSPILGESLPDSTPAYSLHIDAKNPMHVPANNLADTVSQGRSTYISQPEGSNFSDSGDLGIRRRPVERVDAGGRREQDSISSNLRTQDLADAVDPDADSKKALWVIPCFRNSKGDDQVVQVNVSDSTLDGALFSRFRREYFTISSRWRRFVKLHEVTAIRFVMFGLTAGDEPEKDIADVRQTNVWPPKAEPPNRQIWLYDPCPAEKIPLVGQRYMMKVWREPHHADARTYERWRQGAVWNDRAVEWIRHAFPRWVQIILGGWGLDQKAGNRELESGNLPSGSSRADFQSPSGRESRYAIVAIPKKVGSKVKPDLGGVKREEIWGLQFEESFTVHRLLFYILVVYFLGSLVAVIHLYQETTTPISMANKLWIFGWVASIVTLFLTVWLKWAETPK